MSEWIAVQEDELMHHGILGQKWGIRRYQNKDGSLTEKGKQRLAMKEAKKEIKAVYNKQIDVGRDMLKNLKEYPNAVKATMEVRKISLRKREDPKTKNNIYGRIVSNMDDILDASKNSDSKWLREYYGICKDLSSVHIKHMKNGTVTMVDKAMNKAIEKVERMSYTNEFLQRESLPDRYARREKLCTTLALLHDHSN